MLAPSSQPRFPEELDMTARAGPLHALMLAAVSAVLLAPSARAANLPVAAPAAERPLAPERNPPGDIPDTQVFVEYRSPLGFALEVPEGWARTEPPDGVRFVDKYDAVAVTVTRGADRPTVAGVKGKEVFALTRRVRAVRVQRVRAVTLPAGDAVLVEYTSNSAPNAVTGKAVRLENERFLFYRDGRLFALTLSAPYGADNVDQWRRMSRSFRWR